MADDTSVKQLLLQVDATTELLRRRMTDADAAVARFTSSAQSRMDATDARFAQLGGGLDRIKPAIDRANANIGTIGVATARTQKQVEASVSLIRQSLLASTSAIAGAFAIDKVKDYADGYTRFTNQLKVAGLEGRNLSAVQSSLFDIAQKNGAPLEAIGTLYGRAAQTGKALGASQSDLLRFTGAVGAALKVQGGSAEEASGALLQLSQALGSGTVHAEEFNSVNEGLRPLLQAAADASDKYRGNVALLKADVVAQKLSSQEFFQLVLAGYDALQAKASKAGLTIGASFTILNNALGQYVGQTDSGLSATARFAGGIELLADNLGTILPALTAIAIAYGTVKAGRIAFDLVTAAVARASQTDAELAGQVLRGNASFLDRAGAHAKVAVAAREAAAAQVAGIEQTVVALRQEAVQLEANLALIAEQRAAAQQSQVAITAAQALGFGTLGQGGATRTGSQIDAGRSLKAEIATKEALAATNTELAASEEALAAARVTEAAATETAATATAAATLGARVATATTALFSGALTLVAAALPIIAIGALVGAVIEYSRSANEAEENTKAVSARAKDLADSAAAASAQSHNAASGIAAVGTAAAINTGKVQAFAGAVGDAAAKLHQLAVERQRQATQDAADRVKSAQADQAKAGSGAKSALDGSMLAMLPGADPMSDDNVHVVRAAQKQTAADANLAQATANLAEERRRQADLEKKPLESYITPTDRTGSRDLKGELDRINVDLIAARKAGLKSQVNDLEAEAYERKRTIALMKTGESFEAASAQASKEAAQIRSAGQGKINADAAKKVGHERSVEANRALAEQKRSAQDERAYDNASRQALDEIATARQSISTSASEQADIERQRIIADRNSKNSAIDQQGPKGTKTFSQAQVDQLKALNSTAASYKLLAVDVAERRRKEAEADAATEASLQSQQELISAQGQLATTRRERLAIELRLLALQKQEEQLRLNQILAFDSTASPTEKAKALVDQQTIDARYGAKQAITLNQHLDPLQAYGHQLHENTDDMKDALKSVEVDGLKGVEDGFVGIITGTKSVSQAFKEMASSIIADLARIAIEKAIVGLLGNVFGAGSGSVGGVASNGSITNASAAFAFAGGGQIVGPGTGTSDSILARVSNREFIVNAEATAENLPLLHAINSRRLRKFAAGGLVSPSLSLRTVGRSDMAAVASSRSGGITLHLGDRNLYAPGADPAQLARLQAAFEEDRRTMPARVVSAWQDARERMVIR